MLQAGIISALKTYLLQAYSQQSSLTAACRTGNVTYTEYPVTEIIGL